MNDLYKKNIVFELTERRNELNGLLSAINERIPHYRKGSLFQKDNYFYLKYYENGKTISIYLGKDLSSQEINNIQSELESRHALESRKKQYTKEINILNKLIEKYGGK